MRTWPFIALLGCTAVVEDDPNSPLTGDPTTDPCHGRPMLTFHADADKDGFGDPATAVEHCEPPRGHVDNDLDCDDTRRRIHPDQPELCDGLDNDCNDLVDDELGEKWTWSDGRTKEVLVFDAEHRRVEHRWNQNGKGGPDWIHTFRYDAAGNLVASDMDLDNDGTVDTMITWTYDERGNMLTASTDETGGGKITHRYLYTWNDQDLLEKTVYKERRPNGLLTIWRTGTEYNNRGLPVTSWADTRGDFDWDAVSRFEYNQKGLETYRSTDSDNDGEPESWVSTFYNTHDLVKRTESHMLGYDITTRFTYDADQRLKTQKVDVLDDGTVESVITHSWNDNGQVLTVETDQNNDGVIEMRVRTTYSATGKVLKTRVDANGDGSYEATTWTSYHSSGQLRRLAVDTDGDGVEDEITLHSYDQDDRLVGTEWDDDADGVTDRYWTVTIDCHAP